MECEVEVKEKNKDVAPFDAINKIFGAAGFTSNRPQFEAIAMTINHPHHVGFLEMPHASGKNLIGVISTLMRIMQLPPTSPTLRVAVFSVQVHMQHQWSACIKSVVKGFSAAYPAQKVVVLYDVGANRLLHTPAYEEGTIYLVLLSLKTNQDPRVIRALANNYPGSKFSEAPVYARKVAVVWIDDAHVACRQHTMTMDAASAYACAGLVILASARLMECYVKSPTIIHPGDFGCTGKRTLISLPGLCWDHRNTSEFSRLGLSTADAHNHEHWCPGLGRFIRFRESLSTLMQTYVLDRTCAVAIKVWTYTRLNQSTISSFRIMATRETKPALPSLYARLKADVLPSLSETDWKLHTSKGYLERAWISSTLTQAPTMDESHHNRVDQLVSELECPFARICAICQENFSQPPDILVCCLKRNTCRSCMRAWLQTSSCCHMCRAEPTGLVALDDNGPSIVMPGATITATLSTMVAALAEYSTAEEALTCLLKVLHAHATRVISLRVLVLGPDERILPTVPYAMLAPANTIATVSRQKKILANYGRAALSVLFCTKGRIDSAVEGLDLSFDVIIDLNVDRSNWMRAHNLKKRKVAEMQLDEHFHGVLSHTGRQVCHVSINA